VRILKYLTLSLFTYAVTSIIVGSNVPDTGEIINMTNNGYGIMYPILGDPATFSISGREAVYSEDGDTLVMTYHEFIRRDSANPDGKGIIIAVFDRNSTGVLAPFNGMLMVGTHDEPLNEQRANVTLWEWQGGMLLSNLNTTSIGAPSPMNTTIG